MVDGETLKARLEREGLDVAATVSMSAAVAEALAAAHARGVVHRDIKPSNLFLVGGDVERVKVHRLRRGARGVAESDAADRDRRVVLGTPGYMAPEQVRGERDVDARADVFALGCVLYECLTGPARLRRRRCRRGVDQDRARRSRRRCA